ncbi:MAG: hypothetical protein K2X77_01740 [Candidatus Obscuribacterales bacterium]|jgi:tetratricopeptide (TPR) repeat protein|nr:hypothetical protein [Candidatus Obscuribacterales bacterium]
MNEENIKAEPDKLTERESYLKRREMEIAKDKEFVHNLPGPGTDKEKLIRYLEEQKASMNPEYFRRQQNPEAIAIATFSLGYKPISEFRVDEYDQAEVYYTKLLQTYGETERDKGYYWIQYERGLARKLVGNFDGALEDIEKSCESKLLPDDALAIGRYFVLKDRVKANQILDQLLTKYPNCSCLYRYKLGYQNPELIKVLKRLERNKTKNQSGCDPVVYGVCQKMLVVYSRIRPPR